MLKVKKYISVNKFFALIIAVVMLFSVTFAASELFKEDTAAACVFSQKTYYFSDASHSTVIGYKGYLCDGTFVKSGKSSRFTDTLICDCNEDTAK